MALPSIELSNGCYMPAFGFGTWQSKKGVVGEAVKVALESGYRHIDCAHCYGNEVEVGNAFASAFSSGTVKREDVFITSKLWLIDFTRVEEACKVTLKNLQLDYLDLYLIHLPIELSKDLETVVPSFKGEGVIGYEPDRMQEVWKCMEKLVKEGFAKSVGVSNFTVHKLKELMKRSPAIKPTCNQVEMHPYLPQQGLVDYCKGNGIAVVAYSSLGTPGRPEACVGEKDPILMEDAVVKSVAEKRKVTIGQVLLSWALQRGTGALAKSVKESRIKENLECLKIKLDTDDMAALNGIQTRHRYLLQHWFTKANQEPEELWDGELLG